MRRESIILLTLILASGCAIVHRQRTENERKEIAEQEHQRALDQAVGTERNEVVVGQISLVVPTHLQWNDDFMQDNFAATSIHSNFMSITTTGWPLKWRVFSQCLVDKAKNQALDGDSLDKCLSAVAPKVDQISAHVPYAAWQVHDPQTRSNYWGITSVWEHDSIEPTQMGHIRIWLVNASNQTVVGEARCD